MTNGKKVPFTPKEDSRYANQISKHTIELLRNGDQQAYQHIFISYYNNVMRFIQALVKSENDAEELTRDIFAKLWTDREKIDPEKNFRSYLYILARNVISDFFKKKLIRNNDLSKTGNWKTGNTSKEAVFAKELELLISLTVENMPKQRQEIYAMSREQGLSNAQIATQLNITEKTVEDELTQALKEIQKILVAIVLFFS